MDNPAFITFATWFTASFSAIFVGTVLAKAVAKMRRHWKSLPPQLEFLATEPPLRPRKIVFWQDPETAKLIFRTDHARATFSSDPALAAPFMPLATPRGFLRHCWENGIWPEETFLASDADYYGINPLEPHGAARIFFRSVGIE